MPWVVSLDDSSEAEEYPFGLNSYFNLCGVQYMSILKNMGSSLVYLGILVASFLLYFFFLIISLFFKKA